MTPDQKADGTAEALQPVLRVRNGSALRIVVVMAILILSVSVGYDIVDDRNVIIQSEQERLHTQAKVIENNLESQVKSVALVLRSLAQNPNSPGMNQRLTDLTQAMPGFRTLVILDKDGTVTSTNLLKYLQNNFSTRDYFSDPLGQQDPEKLYVSPPYKSVLNQFVITLSVIIPGKDGSFNGVVVASLNPEYFRVLLKSVLYDSSMWSSIIHDNGLLFIMAPEKQGVPGTNLAVPGTFFTKHAQSGKSENVFLGKSYMDGAEQIVAMRTFNPPELHFSKPLVIAVSRNIDAVLVDWRRDSLLKCLSVVILGGFLLLGTFIIIRRQNKLDKHSQMLFSERIAARNGINRSQELQKSYNRLELMQEVAQYHATNVQELLDFSLEKVINLTESSIGYIYHYSEEKKEFVLNTWSKDVMAACKVAEPQSLYQLEKTGIWGEVVRQRKPIVVNDYVAENSLKKGYPEGHVYLSRFLSIPIFDADSIVAVVGVANKALPYDQTDELQLSLMMEGVWKIATRLRLEEQITRAGHEWQSTFDSINDSISLIDTEQRVLRCNRSTCKFIGREFSEIINQPCCKLFHGTETPIPDCPTERAKVSLHSETSTFQHHDRWLEVTVDPILSDNGLLVGAVHIVRDVTERNQTEASMREMQAQMMQNDKLATIGQLAAGVAHEINNPIGFVGSNMTTLAKYVEKYNRYIEQIEGEMRAISAGQLPEQIQVLRTSLKLDYVMRDISVLVEENNEGIDRVKRIVQDLRTFSRADSSAIGSADLNSCMDSTINIVVNEIKYAAELKRDYGKLPKVHCNAQQINQVFMNLLINAAHAIQAKGEEVGEIVIRSWCDQDNAFVSVSDTGCGIPLESQSRIFDAFFTTKEIGKGTGLGLSISSGIIRKHGGEILLKSEVGVGSTFTVRLPLKPPESGEVLK